SASLGPQGYKAYGSTPGKGYHDGTISPSAIAGSIVFVPNLSIKALRNIYDNHGSFVYGRYGFKGAFNLSKKWFADEYLAIDQGVTVLMLENYRSGFVWKYFMKLEPIKNWVALCLQEKDEHTSYSYNR
ncbi:MAG: hypothetical protein HY589_03380, partial [Candidatus Omnitrophica bacterium]|nr:hypothetical protein [Candidatus Omnitrophota bacterium]